MKAGLSKRKKKVAWFLAITGILAVLLMLVNLIAAFYYRPLIKSQLLRLVDVSTNHLYKLEPGKIKINFLNGEISLHGAILKGNDETWNKRQKDGTAPPNKFSITVPEISLKINNFHKALFYGEVHIHLIKISNPKIDVQNDSTHRKIIENIHSAFDSATKGTQSNAYLHRVVIESMIIDGGAVNYRHLLNGIPAFIFHSSGLSLQAGNIVLNNEDFRSLSLPVLLESLDYNIQCKYLDFKNSGGRYLWRAADLEILGLTKELSVNSFSMQDADPGMGAGKRGVTDDRISLTSGSIQMHHADLFKIFKSGKINIPRITVEGMNFTYLSVDTTVKRKLYHMPQEFLKASGKHFTVDSLEFKKCNFNYEEIPSQGGPPGSIRFLNTQGLITHISNDSNEVTRYPDMSMLISTRLYGTGQIETSVHFDLRSTDFSYTVKMGYFALRQVNAITIPLSELSINRGYISSLVYNAEGNSRELKGELAIKYRNLNVKIMQQDTGILAKKRMRLVNSLANVFLVLNDNPLQNEPLRVETVSYTRDQYKSFFNYFWKSMLSGLKPSIGLSANREIEIERFKKTFEQFSKWQKQTKPERIRRKEIRKKKREAKHVKELF